MKKLGIYIHIPFCVKKCGYCDFYSVGWDKESENRYIDAIIKEINEYSYLNNYLVDTIFIGGGTPTVINPLNLAKIIDEIKSIYNVTHDAEISMEANPNTLTDNNLAQYRKIGINRISIGIQSLNDNILKNIGRLHSSKEAIDALDRTYNSGIENINADVMFNIPEQTVKDIENTINDLISHNVKHISFYSLKLEKGTPMYVAEKNNKIVMPDEDYEREMYYVGRNILKSKGLYQYEISNFAMNGYECKHNLKYWNQEEYIGLGPSAHSFINRKRFSNLSDIKIYCTGLEQNSLIRILQENLNENELIFEYIMLKLRLTKGLNINRFKKKFNLDFEATYKNQIDYLIKNNLLHKNNEYFYLTEKGMDISNYVFETFML